jgi:uncharacterized protein YdeI (BOF family)
MRFRLTPLALASVLAFAACRPAGQRILGQAPEGRPQTVAELNRSATPAQVSTVAGEIIEKCPVAGCWFVLRDDTGTVKVDTKSAGFVVLDLPVHTRVQVAGRWVDEGPARLIEATGLRY